MIKSMWVFGVSLSAVMSISAGAGSRSFHSGLPVDVDSAAIQAFEDAHQGGDYEVDLNAIHLATRAMTESSLAKDHELHVLLTTSQSHWVAYMSQYYPFPLSTKGPVLLIPDAQLPDGDFQDTVVVFWDEIATRVSPIAFLIDRLAFLFGQTSYNGKIKEGDIDLRAWIETTKLGFYRKLPNLPMYQLLDPRARRQLEHHKAQTIEVLEYLHEKGALTCSAQIRALAN